MYKCWLPTELLGQLPHNLALCLGPHCQHLPALSGGRDGPGAREELREMSLSFRESGWRSIKGRYESRFVIILYLCPEAAGLIFNPCWSIMG